MGATPTPESPSKVPLVGAVVVVVILAGGFGYYFVTSSSTISSQSSSIGDLNGQVTSLNAVASSLNSVLDLKVSASSALSSAYGAAQGTITEQSSSMGSLSSVVTSQQSLINNEVQQTLLSSKVMPITNTTFNAVVNFDANSTGYVSIGGSSNTPLEFLVCYGVASAADCDSSFNGYLYYFGTGGSTFNVPFMSGSVWVLAYAGSPGTATLTVVEWT